MSPHSHTSCVAINSAYLLGLLVQQRRKALGLVKAELAKNANFIRKWINELESGKPNAQLRTLIDVLFHLGWSVEVEELTTDSASDPLGARRS